jgi:hypothetical protein
MSSKSWAFVVHRTPTRLRIKIPERRRQVAYFAALRRVLVEHPDVVQVEVNPLTASVVINCRPGFDLTAPGNRFLRLKVAPAGSVAPSAGEAWLHPAALDRRIRTLSGGEIGLIAFIIKLVVAIVTKQLGPQLIEWGAEALVRAATQPARYTIALSRHRCSSC